SIAPVLRTDTNGNVGLWQVDGNKLSERLTVTPAGHLGINSQAPTAALEIGSTLRATRNGQALVGLKISPTFDAGGRSNVKNHGLIVEHGNVGIGTTDPMHQLDVNGRMHLNNGVIQRGGGAITNTSDLGLYSRNSGHWIRIVSNNAPIKFFSDDGGGSSQNLSIEPNGDLAVTGSVGIGATAPAGLLEIKGSAASTKIKFG
ncbi:MAG: hypothetical protein GY803_25820, partial [Chloroflexi bacterium]|nr:hypothetical protein [Chloroflexota bacterium]